MAKNILKSFRHAFHGIGFSLGGRNFKIQLTVAILVVIAGFYYKISITEWLAITIMIFSVLAVETLNTAIEETCNIVKDLPGVAPMATREPRDVSAGSALLISICAIIVGLIIFLPKIF